MRDAHRLKEKYELSLDNRQIVTLTVTALIALGGVFVLGVVVGKKLAADQGMKAPADLLTAVDQRTTGLETVQRDAPLTFQEELTRKTPPPAIEAPKPIEAPKAVEPKRPEQKKEDKEAPKLAEAKGPAPTEPAPGVEARPPQTEKPAANPVELAKVVEPKRPDPSLAEIPRDEPVATRTRDGGSLKEAFLRAQKAPEVTADGGWTLQLSAYQDRGEADRFSAGLRDKGYAPYIVGAEIPGKGTWFRVRMGRFASRDAATRYLTDFKRETQLGAIVTNTK